MSAIRISGRSAIAVITPSEAKLLAPFQAPRLKIGRALSHMAELDTFVSDYQTKAHYRWNRWYEPHYEHMEAWWITWEPNMPNSIPLIVGDIAHNLRTTLDILLCDIARQRNKSIAGLKFPFADKESDWNKAIKSKAIRRLGADVQRAISEMGAYRNGPSSGLRAIHDLDILDKHQLIIPVFCAAWASTSLPLELATHLTSRKQDGLVRISSDDTFMVRRGLEITLLPRPKTAPIPYFPNGLPQGSPFAGHPVIETLRDAADNIQKYVKEFALQFGPRK